MELIPKRAKWLFLYIWGSFFRGRPYTKSPTIWRPCSVPLIFGNSHTGDTSGLRLEIHFVFLFAAANRLQCLVSQHYRCCLFCRVWVILYNSVPYSQSVRAQRDYLDVPHGTKCKSPYSARQYRAARLGSLVRCIQSGRAKTGPGWVYQGLYTGLIGSLFHP